MQQKIKKTLFRQDLLFKKSTIATKFKKERTTYENRNRRMDSIGKIKQ